MFISSCFKNIINLSLYFPENFSVFYLLSYMIGCQRTLLDQKNLNNIFYSANVNVGSVITIIEASRSTVISQYVTWRQMIVKGVLYRVKSKFEGWRVLQMNTVVTSSNKVLCIQWFLMKHIWCPDAVLRITLLVRIFQYELVIPLYGVILEDKRYWGVPTAKMEQRCDH